MTEQLSAIELQNKVRTFSGGKIEYLVLTDSSIFAQNDGTYLLSEEGLKGFHLLKASANEIEDWCRKNTERRIAENPEWFNCT